MNEENTNSVINEYMFYTNKIKHSRRNWQIEFQPLENSNVQYAYFYFYKKQNLVEQIFVGFNFSKTVLNYNLIYNFDFDFSRSALTVFMKNIPKNFNVYASYEYRKNKSFDFKICDLNEDIDHSKYGF